MDVYELKDTDRYDRLVRVSVQCTGLRYASEGGALGLRPLPIVLKGRLFVIRENSLRSESCWPYVFVNPLDVK